MSQPTEHLRQMVDTISKIYHDVLVNTFKGIIANFRVEDIVESQFIVFPNAKIYVVIPRHEYEKLFQYLENNEYVYKIDDVLDTVYIRFEFDELQKMLNLQYNLLKWDEPDSKSFNCDYFETHNQFQNKSINHDKGYSSHDRVYFVVEDDFAQYINDMFEK